ncbi:MAG TPA: penicillin-binding transpeptidase domain-containing protein [Planctomycetota bacterium]|nr:penicillin-binding transpeptidase domain-containing protein [Planctomycetota bacterium]
MFRFRTRAILIFLFGGFLMVATRLFYLQVVLGAHYRDYAENVCVETRATEASRGTLRGAAGELLAFDEPGFNVAVVPAELPDWRALCRPILKLYALDRRERIASVRDVAVVVRSGPHGDGYEVSFGVAATFLRLSGTELVERDEHGTALVVVPRKTAAVVDAVSAIVRVPAREILTELFNGLALVGRGWQRPSDPCVVARDVGFLPAAEIESNLESYPGFRVAATARRSYPYDSLASHVLGYVQRVSSAEYDRWHESYGGSKAKRFLPDDLIGRNGVERALDFELRAARGTQTLEVDVARRTQRVLSSVPPVPGADVYLTLDRDLQTTAEMALEGHVGSIVLLEPATGRILAMANSPRYNANELPRRPPDPSDRTAPMLNRAIQGHYPLGSAFKLIVAVAALEENKAPAQLECTGGYLGLRCENHSVPMHLNLEDALKRSCNSYFCRTAHEALGIRNLVKWAALFGLGQCTGVCLPSEQSGLLPTPGWKRARFRENWYAGETCNLAVGQGYLLVTPLQVARFLAAIANGGRLVRPKLVDKIVRADGKVETLDEGVCPTLPLTPSKLERIHRVMRSVCHEIGGTAWKVFRRSETQGDWVQEQGYQVAGKTSTAQRTGRGPIGWFVGFAPANDPRVVFVVTLEHDDRNVHGAEVAAPLARRVLERLPERYLEGVPGRELRERTRQRLAERRAEP